MTPSLNCLVGHRSSILRLRTRNASISSSHRYFQWAFISFRHTCYLYASEGVLELTMFDGDIGSSYKQYFTMDMTMYGGVELQTSIVHRSKNRDKSTQCGSPTIAVGVDVHGRGNVQISYHRCHGHVLSFCFSASILVSRHCLPFQSTSNIISSANNIKPAHNVYSPPSPIASWTIRECEMTRRCNIYGPAMGLQFLRPQMQSSRGRSYLWRPHWTIVQHWHLRCTPTYSHISI